MRKFTTRACTYLQGSSCTGISDTLDALDTKRCTRRARVRVVTRLKATAFHSFYHFFGGDWQLIILLSRFKTCLDVSHFPPWLSHLWIGHLAPRLLLLHLQDLAWKVIAYKVFVVANALYLSDSMILCWMNVWG